jgi:hypothetical protein
MRRWILALMALLLAGQALAAIDTWQFKNEAQEQAFREITSAALPEVPEQQHRGLECDDCRRYAAEGL